MLDRSLPALNSRRRSIKSDIALADDLARPRVDPIFAPSSTEVEVARQATSTIPIVFASHADPVAVGHVTSLARPGGNVTGLSVVMTEMVAKQFEMLKEVLDKILRRARDQPTYP